MIDWLSARYQLIGADEYLARLGNDSLSADHICLSFDDALLCQYDVAAPILDRKNIKAFFFVYSSPFCGDPDPLEVYRYFRTTEYKSIDDFYSQFFLEAASLLGDAYSTALKDFDEKTYLASFPFYSANDKWFRYLRDLVLGKARYEAIMDRLMEKRSFNIARASEKLWMSETNVRNLHNSGHIVGLHSYSHPTTLHMCDRQTQQREYDKNFEHLRAMLGVAPIAMSHPCGNYNGETLDILRRFGIKIGFRSNNSVTHISSNLEVPRDDHANVYKAMHQ
ncbi:hypothetical protein BRI6_0337 [plant metagenome]|uniref:NodB homology domain-containing protein n=1 Tax=plant metagenome TaxID=1297885 RepID=A0A484S3H0_9ZZZZ